MPSSTAPSFRSAVLPRPFLEQHARFEPPHADRAERKGADQTDRFDEDAAATGLGRQRAFPLRHVEGRIELSNLNQADWRAPGAERDRVGEGGAGRRDLRAARSIRR